MTSTEALEAVRRHGLAGRFVLTAHAYQRMRRRNVSLRDVRCALSGALTCEPDGSKWKVTGPGDGDALTCVVVLEEGIVVVTVF